VQRARDSRFSVCCEWRVGGVGKLVLL